MAITSANIERADLITRREYLFSWSGATQVWNDLVTIDGLEGTKIIEVVASHSSGKRFTQTMCIFGVIPLGFAGGLISVALVDIGTSTYTVAFRMNPVNTTMLQIAQQTGLVGDLSAAVRFAHRGGPSAL